MEITDKLRFERYNERYKSVTAHYERYKNGYSVTNITIITNAERVSFQMGKAGLGDACGLLWVSFHGVPISLKDVS